MIKIMIKKKNDINAIPQEKELMKIFKLELIQKSMKVAMIIKNMKLINLI
jgi:hypothetical protein